MGRKFNNYSTCLNNAAQGTCKTQCADPKSTQCGTCLDTACEDPGQVLGVSFTSSNADACVDLPPQECEYHPVQTTWGSGERSTQGEYPQAPIVLGGGWAVISGGEAITDTSFELTFDPAVMPGALTINGTRMVLW